MTDLPAGTVTLPVTDTEGDSFFVVFRTVGQAIAAARQAREDPGARWDVATALADALEPRAAGAPPAAKASR